MTATAAGAARHRQRLIEDFTERLGKYLPESGEPGPWKLAETELSLLEDMNELARYIIESRIAADPTQTVGGPSYPGFGRALAAPDRGSVGHTQTLFGPVKRGRT